MNRAWAMKAETRIAALERQVRELALQQEAERQAMREAEALHAEVILKRKPGRPPKEAA
jgi:hypothetical protein